MTAGRFHDKAVRGAKATFLAGLALISLGLACPARADLAVGAACNPEEHVQPNAGLIEEPGDPGCPAGMAMIESAGGGRFCMDRFEASLLEIADDGWLTAWSPYFSPGNRRMRAVSLRGGVPQGYVSGEQAERACRKSSKRLCTDAEWLAACRGEAQRVYPYGDRREDGRCHDQRAKHPVLELFPNDPAPFTNANMQNACLNQLPGGLGAAGSRENCRTPDGVYDLMGNLHEWTADPDGTFRGGFYVDTRRHGEGCLYVTTAHNFRYSDYSTGFRCCADVTAPSPR